MELEERRRLFDENLEKIRAQNRTREDLDLQTVPELSEAALKRLQIYSAEVSAS